MTQLHDLTALEQAAAVRAGEVSPTQLVEHALARIEALDAGLGAFITVTPERALAAAARAEKRIRAGGELPPLLGVPTAIKDLNNTAGVRTTFGSAVMADFVPAVDDHVVTALAAAGTISVGKTNTPEFGFPCYTDNALAGPARCPWDRSRLAGGSSGGAAVAVAAGMVPFAQGSDGGGSIRIPAAINGIFGHQAHPGPDQQRALRRRRDRPGRQRPAGPDRPRRRRDARRDGGAGARRPGVGTPAAGRRDVPRLGRPSARAAAHRPLPGVADPRPRAGAGGAHGVRGRVPPARGPRPRRRGRADRAARCRRPAVVRAGLGAVGHDAAGARGPRRRAPPADPRAARPRAGALGAGRRWRR